MRRTSKNISSFSVLWVGIKLDKNLKKLEARFQSFNSVRTFRFADKFIRRPGSYHYMEDEIDDINAPQNDNLVTYCKEAFLKVRYLPTNKNYFVYYMSS